VIRHILYSIRPSAGLIVAAIVLAAFRPNENEIFKSILLGLAAFSGSSFCFLINDIVDRDKDILNGKNRPIATGDLPLLWAYGATIFFILVYLLVTYLFSLMVFYLAIFSVVVFNLYVPINQKLGFWANIVVAFCASGSIWGVAIIRAYDSTLFYLAFISFWMILAREILLDWLDTEGDKNIGKSSIPLKFSAKKTSSFVLIIYLVTTISIGVSKLLVPLSLTSYVMLVCVGLSTLIPYARIIKEPSRANILFNIRMSHLSFVFFMLALILR